MAIKKINYHGTSKILLRLCETVNSLIESGGGGGSKHTIINKNGTAMSDRAGLQFTGGATVTDDSVNDKTVVQIPDEQIQSDWEQETTTAKDFIKNKPTIPSEASDISFDDSQCRVISNSDDVQKAIKSADSALKIYGDAIADINLALGDKADDPTTFTEASTRANIASGESFATILGKIKKWFTDLKDLAFIAKDGSTSKYLRGDGTWQTFPNVLTYQTTTVSNANNAPMGVSTINAESSNNPFSTFWTTLCTTTLRDNYVQQIALPWASGSNQIAYRTCDSGTWGSWIYLSNDFVSKASGGTFSGNLTVDLQNGGANNNDAWSGLQLGNNIPKGTVKHSAGYVRLYGHGSYFTDLYAPNSTGNKSITLPDKDGTVALTSDIPTNTNQLTNGAGFITSGDVFSTAEVTNANNAPIGFSSISSDKANNPFSFWATLITTVFSAPGYKQQIAIPWAGGETQMIAVRRCDGGTWGSWYYIGNSASTSSASSSSLVYWDNSVSKPYINIDGVKHHFALLD